MEVVASVMLLLDEPRRDLAALVRMAQVLLDLAQGPQFSNAALDVAADDRSAGELLRLFDRARPHDIYLLAGIFAYGPTAIDGLDVSRLLAR